MNIFEKIIAGIIAIPTLISGLLFPTIPIQEGIVLKQIDGELGAVFSPVQAQKMTLSGSGVSASVTSITLNTFKTPDGREITMSMLGDKGYGTLEPATTREESISFTGVSQSGSDETATLTGVDRGLDFVAPYAASTTLQKAHAGGTNFILTNTSAFYGQQFAFQNATATVTGIWTFGTSTIPRLNASGTYGAGTEEYFATKRYVDSVATSGVADASETQAGKVELATAAETASSTSAGGTGSRLVVPTSLHSATSSVVGTVPIIGSDNALNQNFLGLSRDFAFSNLRPTSSTFTGNTVFNGTTTLNATLTMNGSSSILGTLSIGTSTPITTSLISVGSSSLNLFWVDRQGQTVTGYHWSSSSTTPTLGNCGSGPSIVGTDSAGKITAGSAVTSCNVTFSKSWTQAPACLGSSRSIAGYFTSSTTTGFTLSLGSDFGGQVISYICQGYE